MNIFNFFIRILLMICLSADAFSSLASDVNVYDPQATVTTPSLQTSENAGGHLLDKHVGKTEQQLKDRLQREPRISGSSSFYDQDVAEKTTHQALSTHQQQIDNWLKSGNNRYVLDYKASQPVGISVQRGQNQASTVNSARFILQKDRSMPNGYKILTGYPTR